MDMFTLMYSHIHLTIRSQSNYNITTHQINLKHMRQTVVCI